MLFHNNSPEGSKVPPRSGRSGTSRNVVRGELFLMYQERSGGSARKPLRYWAPALSVWPSLAAV